MKETPGKPVIVVPLYKPFSRLDGSETASLRQLCEVLGKHPVSLCGPGELDWQPYLDFFREQGVEAGIQTFDKYYFSGIEGYNRLMLDKSFYETYRSYSHILIYQTDAYVFEDQLLYWCSLPFDYIGAPWFEEKNGISNPDKFIGVGNGGFSLRNVSSFLGVLGSKAPFYSLGQLYFEYRRYSPFMKMLRFPELLFRSLTGWKNNGEFFAERYKLHEDIFWGIVVRDSKYAFRLPPASVAWKFSFEVMPALLFRKNEEKLPFGCHAWQKYESEFWSPFIR
jgi:hypothetical protein